MNTFLIEAGDRNYLAVNDYLVTENKRKVQIEWKAHALQNLWLSS